MTHSFKCPNCGGPINYYGGSMTVRCEFCSNSVIVPAELRDGVEQPREPASFLEQIGNLKEIGKLIRDGNNLAAVKLYRQTFGVSLVEAKNAVENLGIGRPVSLPHSVTTGPNQPSQSPIVSLPQAAPTLKLKGCRPVIIMAVVGVLIMSVIGGFAFFMISSFGPRRSQSPNRNSGVKPGGINRPLTSSSSDVLKIGSEGIGPGQFKDARTVALDAIGYIYAADYTGGRVQVFHTNGKFVTQWMVDPKKPLLKIAADRKGTVYVVQGGDISKFDGLSGKPLGKVDRSDGYFDDVVVTADGGLVAVQNSEDIIRYDSSGQVVSTIKKSVSTQSGDSELDAKVAVDGLGNIYAMGRFNDAVFKFAADGKFITRIGGGGDESGLFRALNGIAVDGQGRIYVSDIKGIQVFESNGRYLRVIKVEKNVPFGMVFSDANELVVAARTQILVFPLDK